MTHINSGFIQLYTFPLSLGKKFTKIRIKLLVPLSCPAKTRNHNGKCDDYEPYHLIEKSNEDSIIQPYISAILPNRRDCLIEPKDKI